MKILLFLFGFSTTLHAQDYVYDLWYYLSSYPCIVEGTVEKTDDYRFKIKVGETYKGDKSRFIRVRYNDVVQPGTTSSSGLGIEKGKNYIFILGQKKIMQPRGIGLPQLRFPVENDSIFISSALLDQVTFDTSINIYQKNPQDDPLIPKGYMLSRAEFVHLINLFNSTYYFTGHCYAKLQETDNSCSAFERGLLLKMDELWKAKPCVQKTKSP